MLSAHPGPRHPSGVAPIRAGRFLRWWPREEQINTWANHLIVIFCFAAPMLVDIRRSALSLILALFLIRGRYIRYLSGPIRDPVVLSLTVYFLIHVVWLVGTEDWSMAKKVTHDAAFLLIPLVFATFINPSVLPRMSAALWLGMGVGVLWAIAIHLEILPPRIHDGGHGTPWSPTPVWNPQPWVFMLSVTVVALLSSLQDLHRQRWLFGTTAALVLLAAYLLVIEPQRTGWVMGAVLLVAWAGLQFGKSGWKHIGILVIFILVGGVMAYHQSGTFRFHADATAREIQELVGQDRFAGSVGWRAAIVYYGIQAGKEDWLLGLGTGDHLQPVKRLLKSDDSDIGQRADVLQHLHGEYITAFLQFGVVGLVLFLNIILQLARYPGRGPSSRLTFRLLALAIAMYSVVDLFIIGFGSLLLAMSIIALGLRRYEAVTLGIEPLGWRSLGAYAATALVFAAMTWMK